MNDAAEDTGHGGAINNRGNLELLGCTITQNSADDVGGGIFTSRGRLDLIGSILYGNTDDAAGTATDQIKVGGPPGIVCAVYSDVEGDFPCCEDCDDEGGVNRDLPGNTDNIDKDPNFQDAGANDFRLHAASDCVDTGDDGETRADADDVDDDADDEEAVPDILLSLRIQGDAVDMGGAERCIGDVSDNGVVNANDFKRILIDWGCTTCPLSDVDGDGVVGFSDLVIVQATWGCGAFQTPSSFAAWLSAETCLDESDWDLYVDIMTDSESTETEKANATCWLDHYMHCTSSCGTSPCNGTDPFGNACGGH